MTRPPFLESHSAAPSIPSSDTLDEAVLWDYSVDCYFEGDASFEVTFNEEQTFSYAISLNDEISVTSPAGRAPLVISEAVEDAAEYRKRTFVFPRLDVVDVQSARMSIQGISFPEPIIPFIENGSLINAGGAPATITAHLTSLLQSLLDNSPFASQPISIECRYGYTIGGVVVEAPVLLLPRQDFKIGFDEKLIGEIDASITQWLDAVQPPATDARLIFGLTLWTAIPRRDERVLRLTNVSLPMTDVTR